MDNSPDHHWMSEALKLARQAEAQQEVPVGALIVNDSLCIGQGWNQVRMRHDPCAHAEIIAIQQACQQLQYERLSGATLYVTLEPCIMCVGALLQARISRLVFGTRDFRAGAAGTCLNVTNALTMYPAIQIDEGVRQVDCERLLKRFFSKTRL